MILKLLKNVTIFPIKKNSGYRSYHVVIRYPVQTINGEKKILAEIQIRTLAMNFWATIEHSLNYKYKGAFSRRYSTSIEACSRGSLFIR